MKTKNIYWKPLKHQQVVTVSTHNIVHYYINLYADTDISDI